MLIPRQIRPYLLDLLTESRAVAILGARQVGKSTLLLDLAAGGYVTEVATLDDDTTRAAAEADPAEFVSRLRTPAAIDEVQRVPDLLLAIKQRLDRDNRRGQFLLTGSANIVALPTVKDALPGRVDYVSLWPLSAAELAGRSQDNFVDRLFQDAPPDLIDIPLGRDAYAERIVRGGYPEAQGRSRRALRSFFTSYLDSIIERDVGDVANLRAPDSLNRLLEVIASRSGGLMSFQGMGRDLGLDKNTVHSYTRALENLFLVRVVKPWHVNLGTRQVKSPKLYIVDSGLLCRLLNADTQRIETDGAIAGAAFESYVAMELLRLAEASTADASIFHYRDKKGREIDVVLESANGEIAGVETKAAATVHHDDFAGLRHLRDKLDTRFKSGVVLYAGQRTLPFGDRLWAVPIAGLSPKFSERERAGRELLAMPPPPGDGPEPDWEDQKREMAG
jgi:predicted AAA+ superfamily ATPase